MAPHPVVVRERSAVARLDGGEVALAERLAERLVRLEAQSLAAKDYAEFPCLRHAAQGREQIRELLERHPLAPGEIVLELGADHCRASSLLLDAGCRVIASDITDHLRLAPRGADEHLRRIKADMNDVPPADATVDVVWATAAAHHSWSLERTFAESARVLRPGGRLYFCCEPMPSWLRYPLGWRVGRAERELGINETWLPRSRWLRAAELRRPGAPTGLPTLDRRTVEQRLRSRHLPAALAPPAERFTPVLQVASIHLPAARA